MDATAVASCTHIKYDNQDDNIKDFAISLDKN